MPKTITLVFIHLRGEGANKAVRQNEATAVILYWDFTNQYHIVIGAKW